MADKINELSKNALTRYMGPAAGSLATAKSKGPYRDHYTAKKREKGIAMAHKKLQKNEDEQVMENQIKIREIVECVYKGKLNGLSEEVYAILSGLAEDEWRKFRQHIWYDFKVDNNFNELKEQELQAMRMTLLTQMDPFVGRYFSMYSVKKKVLQMTDDEIEEENKRMEEEREAGLVIPGMGLPGAPNAGMVHDVDGNPIDPQEIQQGEQDHEVAMASLKLMDTQEKAKIAGVKASKKATKKTSGSKSGTDIDSLAKKMLFSK